MTSPFHSKWSLGDIDDIEQTIYMLNRPSSDDMNEEQDNFGWNSPIKFHRFAATPKASAKKAHQNNNRSNHQTPEQLNNLQFDENSIPNRQRGSIKGSVMPSSLDSLLKSVEIPTSHNNNSAQQHHHVHFSPQHHSPAGLRSRSPGQARLNQPYASARALLSKPQPPARVIDQEEFLQNAKKQLEFELAQERHEHVLKLKKILSEGAKSHIEQKRRDTIQRMVSQTDTLLQHAYEDILTEAHSLFSTSTTSTTTAAASHAQYMNLPKNTNQQQPPRETYNAKYRDILKRIKVAEQEKIKQKVQQSVQQVATHLVQEETAQKERIQMQTIITK